MLLKVSRVFFCRKSIPTGSRCSNRYKSSAVLPNWCSVSDEVQSALQSCPQRVIALESTVITHGLPWPLNLETAIALEEVVRHKGCVPATIAVLKGQVHAGLSLNQLETIAQCKDAVKLSKRDLTIALVKRLSGGTTVSATSCIASQLGIRLFATGGLGGVHRAVETSWDISNDLRELGNNPIAVVCAGVKSILDIAKSLEYLETEGVLVTAFGTDVFPGFYVANSGLPAPHQVRDASEAAEIITTNQLLSVDSGIVIAVPPPDIPDIKAVGDRIEQAVQTALLDAK